MDRDDAERFFHHLGLVGTGIGVALGIDYLFYLFTGRLLGPTAFGIFGTVSALYYLLIAGPGRALEMTTKRLEADGTDALEQFLRPTILLGAAMAVLLFAAAPVTGPLMDVPVPVMRVFALTFPFAYLVPVMLGRIHGQERFGSYALYEFTISIAKLSGVLFILAGLGVAGAVLGLGVELLVGAALVYLILRPRATPSGMQALRLLGGSTLFIAAIYAAFSIDIILLSRFFDHATVGRYNAVAVLGKAVFFGAVAVNRTVFPKLVKEQANRVRYLFLSLGLILLGGTTAALLTHLVGSQILAFTFGSGYISAASYASLYMVFITAVSACALLGNYYLSQGHPFLRAIVLLPVLETLGILLFHNTVTQIILAGTAAAGFTLLILLTPVIRDAARQKL